MSLSSNSSISLGGLYQSKSRWSEIVDVRNILPNIFPDPRKPLYLAKMALQEPPQELLERYIEAKSTDERLKVLAKFYDEIEGVVFETSCLLRDLEKAKRAASEKRKTVYQLFGEVLDRHIEHKADGRPTKLKAKLRELVVHPLNTRIIPHDADAFVGNFDQLCKERGLKDPLLVVPVAPQDGSTKRVAEDGKEDEEQVAVKTLAEVHVKLFDFIQQKIMMLARSDAELERVIKLKGIGWVNRAVTGYREVMLKDGRLVFTENDPFCKAFREHGIRLEGPKYFVIDGQMRALAMSRDFLQGLENGTYSPDGDEVYVQIIYDADLVTVPYLSIVLNTGLREVSEEELRRFFGGAGGAFSASLRTIADVIGSKIVEDATKKYHHSSITELTSPRLTVLGKDVAFRRGLYEPLQSSEKESEKEEEKREERKEEPARRAGVSEVQRQFAPTYSYAPAQQQNAIQMPMSHLASAQPIREEAQRPGQAQPVQLNEISVLSVALDTYFARHNPQAHYYVFPGKGIDVRLDYNLKKALENSGLSGRSLEVDIRYTGITDLPVKGTQLKAKIYVPVAYNKYCINCGHLIVLSPTRCVFCGEVINPLPYVVSYKPAGT